MVSCTIADQVQSTLLARPVIVVCRNFNPPLVQKYALSL